MIRNNVIIKGVPLVILPVLFTDIDQMFQWVLSWLLHQWGRLSVTNLSLDKTLLSFQLNAPVVIRTKDAFSRNVGKVFTALKLVTDNLHWPNDQDYRQIHHTNTHSLNLLNDKQWCQWCHDKGVSPIWLPCVVHVLIGRYIDQTLQTFNCPIIAIRYHYN